jgi:hypothetical protein
VSTHSPTGIFNLPPQNKPGKNAFDTRPSVVAAWIARLPMGSTGETARQIFTALREMNRLDISPKDRLKGMEAFNGPVQTITTSLKKHFVNQNLPLSPKGQKVAELAIQLHSEMAIGYKAVVANTLEKSFILKQNAILTTAIHRAIRYLNNVLLFSYQLYSQHPEFVWLQIHRLYLLAEDRQLHEHTVKETHSDGSHANTSITEIYKQALLLALAGPYRLRQQVTEAVYQALQEWARLADIETYAGSEEDKFALTINLNSDAAPGYFRDNGSEYPEYYRNLNSEEIIRVMNDILEDKAEPPPGISNDILTRLLVAWRGQAQRAYARKAKTNQINITLGLSATHHYIDEIVTPLLDDPSQCCPAALAPLQTHPLNGATTAEALVLDNPANYTSTPVFGISNIEEHTPDVWEPDYTYRANNPILSFRPAEEEENKRRRAVLYNPFSCKSINESAGGYCLIGYLSNTSDPRKVQVGDLVGIKDSANPSSTELGIGVIRRIKNWPDGIELGIQKLAPCACAIAIADTKHGPGQQERFQRGLALPEIGTLGQPPTIITHTWHRSGDEVVIHAHGQHSLLTLGRQLENTGVYAQFEYSVKEANLDTAGASESGSEDEFAAIWDHL